MNDKFLSALGLAKRAGKAVYGTELVRDALRQKKARLVIMAGDISKGTKKQLTTSCEYYNTEYIEVLYTMSCLAKASGFERLVSSVAICDENFVKLIKSTVANNFSAPTPDEREPL